MKFLLNAVALSFLLLCLAAVGGLPLPSFIETGLKWAFGLSLLAGAAILGPPFLQRVFGR